MIKIVIIIITGAFAALGSYLTDKFDKDIRLKALVVAVIVIIGGLCGHFYDRFDEKRSRPFIEVKREIGADYLALNIVPDEKPGLKAIRLSLHLPVRVTQVQSENRITNGKAEVTVVGGTDKAFLTNRVDVDIYQASPGRSMSFLLNFKPVKEVSLDYAGKGLYELTYVWSHGANDIQESE